MSGNGRNRGHRRNNHNNHNSNQTLSSVAREATSDLADDSPTMLMFQGMHHKLTNRQDRNERLVKCSRDVTIESKRIIFLLHSIVKKESLTKKIEEAKERIQKLINGPIKAITLELENSPAYLHSRAVTAGYQEYIEARTLLSLMEKKEIITYPEVLQELTYTTTSEEGTVKTLVALVPQLDYMLGLADLSGELMRRAINSISSGDSEDCFFACQAVRELYAGFLGLFNVGKEIARKQPTTRANVSKVEYAVYALRVRGGEAPPSLLLGAAGAGEWDRHAHSDDEGFY
ncbi:putative translin-associated factor X [Operophtera brumata]|uniref:Putative translin-associated factor X n=1 Tax=Operophtera brumata TaxID=104452 RepID=A0A0L7L3R8_OPEBR|nr:putative translin-associated factor X [Operophtera brumata]